MTPEQSRMKIKDFMTAFFEHSPYASIVSDIATSKIILSGCSPDDENLLKETVGAWSGQDRAELIILITIAGALDSSNLSSSISKAWDIGSYDKAEKEIDWVLDRIGSIEEPINDTIKVRKM